MDSRRNRTAVLAVLISGLCACTHRAVVWEDEGGLTGDMSIPGDHAGLDLNTRDWQNPAAPDYIYLVEQSGLLLRFSPNSKKVHAVGKIGCLAIAANYAFSMSVDRFGVAWVNVLPSVLVRVNTTDAACQPTGYKARPGYDRFGMGFALTGPGSTQERLYIASAVQSFNSTGMLATLDTTTLEPRIIGPFPKEEMSPELTGTRNGKLYGYFPGQFSSLVARLDQQTAQAITRWKLPGLGHNPGAWAFAHWGGMFYLFISDTGTSRVLRLDPSTGQIITWVSDLGHRVVGAGVSSRAPGAANDLGI